MVMKKLTSFEASTNDTSTQVTAICTIKTKSKIIPQKT